MSKAMKTMGVAEAMLGAGAAKYTLIVRTMQVEPGATIGLNTQAWATLEVRLVDTTKKDVALATIGIEKIRPATKKWAGSSWADTTPSRAWPSATTTAAKRSANCWSSWV